MKPSFISKLREQAPLSGMLMTLREPALIQIASQSGFDWIFIDGEHSSLDYADIENLLRATHPECYGIVRIPKLDEIWTKKVLDAGAEGVIFPQVNTPEDAARAVKYCTYPPEGDRSTGMSRAHGYGKQFESYMERANRDIAVIIQVEQEEGANSIEEIVKVRGVDMIFIGPYDLSASLGVTGEVTHPKVTEAIKKIQTAARGKKLPVGIFAMNTDTAREYIKAGFEAIAVGLDFLYFSNAIQETLTLLQHKPKKK